MKPVSPIPRQPRSRIVVGAPVVIHPTRLAGGYGLLRRPPILASGLGGDGNIHVTLDVVIVP